MFAFYGFVSNIRNIKDFHTSVYWGSRNCLVDAPVYLEPGLKSFDPFTSFHRLLYSYKISGVCLVPHTFASFVFRQPESTGTAH